MAVSTLTVNIDSMLTEINVPNASKINIDKHNAVNEQKNKQIISANLCRVKPSCNLSLVTNPLIYRLSINRDCTVFLKEM